MYIHYRKDRGTWEAQVWNPRTRKPVCKSDRLKSVVKRWAERMEEQLRATGGLYDPRAGDQTFGQYVSTRWKPQRHVAPSNRDRERTCLARVMLKWSGWSLNGIQASDVGAWREELEAAGESPFTISKCLVILRSVLELALEDHVLLANAAVAVRAPRAPKHEDRVLTDDEVALLIRSIPARTTRSPNGVFTEWLAATGMRYAEAAGLPDRLIDMSGRVALVRWVLERDGTFSPIPKTDAAYRRVPLTDELCKLVEGWRGRAPVQKFGHPAGGAALFSTSVGTPLSYRNFLRAWDRGLEIARLDTVPKATPHDLRHYVGTLLARRGMPQHEIGRILGHKEGSKVTARYLDESADMLDRARAILGRDAIVT